ncbi:hypothetical protein QJS10_CPA05g00821 [Acorus calamus]|uniref:Rho GTPase-activating protein 7 n=1 Tax=Acorus calamus TaxID=4465 RepID=A0AAV9ETC7_ACOCL|nr:hypothetical protein QJS10_CPA05g00821 [Acorus calamus]
MSSAPAVAPPFERPPPRTGGASTVFKSGPLFISSKANQARFVKDIWSALPQRGGEVNLTLGGIDLNNSGSVVVREDKKLLTVLFPEGRDGRAFTLKAESSEDLYEWKAALEQALAQAPNAALVMGHNGIFRNDTADAFEGSVQQWRDKRPVKSLVVGRPILLALEDIDGSPSFLEKALRFLEKFGSKVEGILRQSADVEEVDRRVQEYEQGRTEFGADEDAHVVGDCVKHVLRELPSSPVPASCCTALLEAYRIERKDARVDALRSAIMETFPEPNRRLLQRILKMMHTIAAHKSENRMTPSAVAACMAPLLLRPLLAGECELEDDFDMSGDGAAQLLAAANAANNAQAIITALLEDYENMFHDDNLHRSSLSPDSPLEDSGSDVSTDDGDLDMKENGYHDAENDIDPEIDDDPERVLSGKLSESSGGAGSDLYDYKVFGGDDSEIDSPGENRTSEMELIRGPNLQYNEQVLSSKIHENSFPEKESSGDILSHEPQRSMGDILSSMDPELSIPVHGVELYSEKTFIRQNGLNNNTRRPNFWGRNRARKNLSMESVDSSGEEELAIQRLELTKNDLRNRIAKEAKGNAILQASLERRKQALHERRLALEQDVSRLQEQLQAERDLRAALEVGLSMSSGNLPSSRAMDSKTRAELEEIALAEADVTRLKQKVAELHLQLNQQRQHHYSSLSSACDRKALQQDFDATLASCNNERKHRSEETSSGTEWKNTKQLIFTSPANRQISRKLSLDSESPDSKSTEASTSNSAEVNSRATEGIESQRHPPATSALVELTTRLDFFKERRSQLMEQLHNLDLSYGMASQGLVYKASPPWTSPR